MHPLVNVGVKAAREAGKTLLQSLDHLESVTVSKKKANDFVSDVDKLVEEEIINVIRQRYPNHSVLAEESGESQGTDEFCWIIDPLDGTANFLHGVPHFAVSIAVKQNNKLIAGVIFDPVRNELFTAAKGEGARLNDVRMRVSKQDKLEDAMLGTGFPFKRHDLLEDYQRKFNKLFVEVSDMRRAGSASLDLAYIAAGRLDGFWEMFLEPWDMAAGILMIREAGGLITDLSGGEDYFKKKEIIAANPKMLKAMLERLKAS